MGTTLGMLVPGALVLEKDRFPRDKPCGEGLLPAGVEILGRAGVDLGAGTYPPVLGVTYRLPQGPMARAPFPGVPGRGVRRARLDAELAGRCRLIEGCRVLGVRQLKAGVEVSTSEGPVGADVVVAADGIRSGIATALGWGPSVPRGSRIGVVGHLETASPGDDIVVTLMRGYEVYLCPVGPTEVLVALLGGPAVLRSAGPGLEAKYRELVGRACPELRGARLTSRLLGCGPFDRRPGTVARGRILLAGDCAGFLDPITGDGLTAGLQQAEQLASLLSDGWRRAVPEYRRWWARQWRRRRVMSWVAHRLCTNPQLARGAVAAVAQRPSVLGRLLEVDQGAAALTALGPGDWLTLLGARRP